MVLQTFYLDLNRNILLHDAYTQNGEMFMSCGRKSRSPFIWTMRLRDFELLAYDWSDLSMCLVNVL